jgi:hypothetical protein
MSVEPSPHVLIAGKHLVVAVGKEPSKDKLERGMLLSRASDLAGSLATLCGDYALSLYQSSLTIPMTAKQLQNPNWSYMLDQFHNDFCRGFFFPFMLLEGKATEGEKCKAEIISLFEKYNALPKEPNDVTLLGDEGFLKLSYNEADEKFYYPTFDQLKSAPWLLNEVDVLLEIKRRWYDYHYSEQK